MEGKTSIRGTEVTSTFCGKPKKLEGLKQVNGRISTKKRSHVAGAMLLFAQFGLFKICSHFGGWQFSFINDLA